MFVFSVRGHNIVARNSFESIAHAVYYLKYCLNKPNNPAKVLEQGSNKICAYVFRTFPEQETIDVVYTEYGAKLANI